MKRVKSKKKQSPELFIIAGPNGSGKTAFAREFLPHYVRCLEFVNADYIASGISPFRPEIAAIDAGRIMLTRIDELIKLGRSFGFETTLAGRGYVKLLREMRERGCYTRLYFLWLPNASLAVKRVAQRVRKGGHDIPEEVIRRRFDAGLKNFFDEYRFLVDEWILWDASVNPPVRVASSYKGKLLVEDESLYNRIISRTTRK